MTTPTNWPNPERPGAPMFPEHDGKHVLFSKETGNDITADWNEADAEWLLPNGSLKAKNAAKYYIYSHCDSVELTPLQISEMLAAERERCADECTRLHIGMPGHEEWNAALQDCRVAIRNLGAAT